MRNRRIQPALHARTSSGRWLRRRCSPRSPNEAPTPSDTPTARRGENYPTVVKQRTPASRAPRARRGARRPRPSCWCTCATTPRATPRSTPTTIPFGTGRSSASTTGSSLNDDELLAPHSCARAEPRMTVDSEAIFAVAAHSRNAARALEHLRGAMATAWIDEREPDGSFSLAAPAARCGSARAATASSSPRPRARSRSSSATAALRLRKREVGRARCSRVAGRPGRRARERFRPDLDYVEDDPLPAVRAPQERDSCLLRLAALAPRSSD